MTTAQRPARGRFADVIPSICTFLLLGLSSALRADQFGDFSYTSSGTAITVTGYTGAGGAVSIPDIISGLPVTTIGNDAFGSKRAVTSVLIPNGVTSIGSNAFRYCSGLSSLTIPDTVTSIGAWAFHKCTGLSTVNLSANLSSIDGYSFSYCTGLTSVTLPASITYIGTSAFAACTALTAIAVDPDNQNFSSSNGVLLDKTGTSVIQYPGGKAGAYALPASVTSIGIDAFRGCAGLTSATLSASVTSIEDGAFMECTAMSAITVDTGNPNYSSLDGVLFNKTHTELVQFPGGKTGAYTIPPGVTTVAPYAFLGCISLTGLSIPASVTSIGDGAFRQCTGLTSIAIPASVTAIRATTFYACTGLSSVSIPASVTSIESSVFSSCSGLSSVSIPASVTSIGSNAFSYCYSLTSALFTGNAPTMGSPAFYGTSADFSVYFIAGASGFTTPTWQGYPATGVADGSIVTHPAGSTSINMGDTVTLKVVAIGTGLLTYQWYQGASGTTSTPVGTNSASFTSPPITASTSYWVRVTNVANPAGALSNTAMVTVVPPIQEAVDLPGAIFTFGGAAPWLWQSLTTHDGVDAARSGAITDSQTSEMSTTVTGPATLSFWWKVSSESGYDYLRFYIDGVEQTGKISGAVDWTPKSYSLAAGSHTLKWSYSKDPSDFSGSDCGWVDQVAFVPANSSPEIAVEQPVGNNLVDGSASVAFGNADLGTTVVRTFTVRDLGALNLGGLALSKDGPNAGDFMLGSLGTTSLAPGASTTFTVTFAPGSAGTKTAAIHIASNDPDENPFDISLSGEGLDRVAPFVGSRRIASTVNEDFEPAIGLALDGQGNRLVTGWFDGINDFGGLSLTALGGGGQDIFVGKYDSAGVLQWARRAGGATAERDAGRGIGVDNAGNVYVTGGFSGTADFGSFSLTASQRQDVFLAKYNSAGIVQWVRKNTAGSPTDSAYSTGIAVDGTGNSYALGYYDGANLKFGGTTLPAPADYQCFLVKHDAAGTVQWATALAASGQVYATKLALDSQGGVCVGGEFSGSMELGGTVLVSAGGRDLFVARFNSAGVLQWARRAGGAGKESGDGGVAVDSDGNVIVGGSFESASMDIGGIVLTNSGGMDAFVAKYDSSGTVLWASKNGTAGLDFVASVAVDGQGNSYAAGAVGSSGGTAGVAKYDHSGTLQWEYAALGSPADPVASIAAHCAVDASGNCHLVGWYQGQATFGTQLLQPQGYLNYFLTTIPADGFAGVFPDQTWDSHGNVKYLEEDGLEQIPGCLLKIVQNDATHYAAEVKIGTDGGTISNLVRTGNRLQLSAPLDMGTFNMIDFIMLSDGTNRVFASTGQEKSDATDIGLDMYSWSSFAGNITVDDFVGIWSFESYSDNPVDPNDHFSRHESNQFEMRKTGVDSIDVVSPWGYSLPMRVSGNEAFLEAPTLIPGHPKYFSFRICTDGQKLSFHAIGKDTTEGNDTFAVMGLGVKQTTASPVIATSAATGVTVTSATLNGTVNPNGLTTTAQFEYGLTTSYGSTKSVTLSPDNGTGVQNVSAGISGLMSGKTYHYRLAATNSVGTATGSDQSFTTPAPEIVVEQPLGTQLADGTGSVGFGSVALGANASKTFTIKNTGSASLTGLALTKGGTHTADFTVTANPASTVGPAGSSTFTVRFTPGGTATRSASIHISSNDADEDPFDIVLTGTGIGSPEIAVQQPAGTELKDGVASRSFGTIAIKSTVTKTFTIRNAGTANLTNLAVTKTGANAKDFTVKSPLKSSLAPGASTTLSVVFKPSATGIRKAAIHIKSNDSNENPFDIALTGKGTISTAAPSALAAAAGLPARAVIDTRQTTSTVRLDDGRKYLTLTFVKSPENLLLKSTVEVSPNLIDWYSGREHTTVIIDDSSLLVVRDNTPLKPNSNRYIRVKTAWK